MTASHLVLIDLIRIWHKSDPLKESHTCSQWDKSARVVLSRRLFHLWTIIPHRFSMGFKSGERDGQRTVLISACWLIHVCTMRAVWIGQLSCMNRNSGTSCLGYTTRTVGSMTVSSNSLYVAPVALPGIWANSPGPSALIQPHMLAQILPDWSFDMTWRGSYRVFVTCQRCFRPSSLDLCKKN